MMSFDAPNREVCTVARLSTNTPLQALVLLNDPQFVEASRAFGAKMMVRPGDLDEKLTFAFEQATARPPTSDELDIIRGTFERELKRYQKDPKQAAQYLRIGESDQAFLEVTEHAAWASVAMLLLNLSETITKG